jgi:DNA-binding beta-propeller fold protein YncE
MSARSALPIAWAVCLLAWPATAPASPDCVLQWTTSGSVPQPAEFSGVAYGPAGRIFVADAAGQRILKFNVDGNLLGFWGSPGTGDGEFQYPSGIAVDGSGFVYVADAFNHRIQKFTSNGAFLTAWGGAGTEPGRFRTATGVAVDGSGFVYATDLGNHRVQKFTSEGTPLATWEAGGPIPGENGIGGHPGHFRRDDLVPNGVGLTAALAGLEGPIDLAVDGDGVVYVLDGAGLRVERFTGSGTPLPAWDLAPVGATAPTGITASSCGTVFVTDMGSGQVVVATPNGWSLDAWSSYEAPPLEPRAGGHRRDHFERYGALAGISAVGANRLERPGAVAVDALNRVLVVESGTLLGFSYPSPVARLISGVYPWHAANVCPTWSAGRIPIGVLGHACMPVTQVDLESLVLAGAGAPVGCRFCDLGRPGADGTCPEHGGDGCCDLILEFHGTQILTAAGRPGNGETAEITLLGRRADGTPLWGVLRVEIQRFKPGEGGRTGEHIQRLAYTVPEASPVRIGMYDVRGRLLGRVVDEVQAAGGYEITPPVSDLPGGVYFFRIEIGTRVETRKLVVVP